jgi:hypothetical protein
MTPCPGNEQRPGRLHRLARVPLAIWRFGCRLSTPCCPVTLHSCPVRHSWCSGIIRSRQWRFVELIGPGLGGHGRSSLTFLCLQPVKPVAAASHRGHGPDNGQLVAAPSASNTRPLLPTTMFLLLLLSRSTKLALAPRGPSSLPFLPSSSLVMSNAAACTPFLAPQTPLPSPSPWLS